MEEGKIGMCRALFLVGRRNVALEFFEGRGRERPQALGQLARRVQFPLEFLTGRREAFRVVANSEGASLLGQPFSQAPGFAVLHSSQKGVFDNLTSLAFDSLGIGDQCFEFFEGRRKIFAGHEASVFSVKAFGELCNVGGMELPRRHGIPEHVVLESLGGRHLQSLSQLLLALDQKINAGQIPRQNLVGPLLQELYDFRPRHGFQRNIGDFDLEVLEPFFSHRFWLGRTWLRLPLPLWRWIIRRH